MNECFPSTTEERVAKSLKHDAEINPGFVMDENVDSSGQCGQNCPDADTHDPSNPIGKVAGWDLGKELDGGEKGGKKTNIAYSKAGSIYKVEGGKGQKDAFGEDADKHIKFNVAVSYFYLIHGVDPKNSAEGGT